MKLPTRDEAAYHGARWVWLVALAVLAYLAFPRSTTDLAPLLEPGAVAERDVVAPFNYVVTKSSQEIQREADELAASAKPIYQFQQAVYDSTVAGLRALFAAMEEAADQGGAAAVTGAAARFGVTLTAVEAAYLARDGKRRAMARALEALLERTLGRGAARREVLEGEPSRELIIRRRTAEVSVARDQVGTYQVYLTQARALPPDRGSSAGDAVYLKLANRFFRATLVLDRELTEQRRASLRGSVDPRKYFVGAGEVIVAQGSVVSSEAHERLLALHQELVRRGAATSLSVRGVLGPVLLNTLILSVFWVLLLLYRRETYREVRQVAVIAGVVALTILGSAAVAHIMPQRPEAAPLPFLGDLEVVPDFLPRPEDLVFRDEGVKVTIALSKRSVEFFKSEAQKHNTQYQRMIRRLLDAYAEHHSRRSLTARSARTRAKSARAG